MMEKLKVVTVVGTRPEIIRLSEVIKALDRFTDHILVHTGQNWDFELNEALFQDLGLRRPDYVLNAGRGSLGAMIGTLMIEIEKVFETEKPDALVILGDTNSALCTIIAKRRKIAIFHMEAGNRCFDFNVPEEVNRRIVDHISDFNLVYTEHARRNLLAEGLPSRRIYLTGSPLFEVIAAQMAAIDASHALEELGLKKGGYLLASLHREENVDRLDHLKALLATLEELAEAKDVPVVLSTHPRTRKRLEEAGIRTDGGRILFHKPFSFSAYCRLQKDALCVVSDSGTISEEAVILGFAAVTPRQAIERPEALDCGSVVLTGLKARDIGLAIETSLALFAEHGLRSTPAPYRVPNTSERVVKLVVGLTDLSALWHGYTSPGEAL